MYKELMGPQIATAPPQFETEDIELPAYEEIYPNLDLLQSSQTNPVLVDCKNIPEFLRMTNEDARRALLNAQNDERCLSRKFQIGRLDYTYVHAYCLETLIEKRETVSGFEKYKTSITINDERFGRVPDIWEFVPPNYSEPLLFNKERVEEWKIPFTECLQYCSFCLTDVNGSCLDCGGSKKLRYFQKCKITWSTKKVSSFSKQSLVSDDLLENASGYCIFSQMDKTVNPINYIQDETISAESVRLINSQRDLFKFFRILKQRHRVSIIPITTVHYTFKGQSGVYYIYGSEKKVYAPNLLDSSCSIM